MLHALSLILILLHALNLIFFIFLTFCRQREEKSYGDAKLAQTASIRQTENVINLYCVARLFTSHFSNFMRDTFQIFPLFSPHFAHFSMMNIEQETHAEATPRCSVEKLTQKAQFSSHFQSSCHVLTCRQFDCHSSSSSHYSQHRVSKLTTIGRFSELNVSR